MGIQISLQHTTIMAKVLQTNRFQTLGNDCEDVENTEEIVQSAVKAAKKVNKINQLEYKNQKHNNFFNGLITAKYGDVIEPVKPANSVIENSKNRNQGVNNSRAGFKKRDEFDFAKPGFGFVERFEGVGYDKKVINNG